MDRFEGASDPPLEQASPDRFATVAEDLAARWSDLDLDFSPASLARLDEYVTRLPADRRADAGDVSVPAALGCYLGETLVRTADAAWVETEPGCWTVVVYGDSVTVNVFAVARDALRDPPALARAHETAVDAASE